MSTPLLSEIVPEIDANPVSFYGGEAGRGLSLCPDPHYRLKFRHSNVCPPHNFRPGDAPVVLNRKLNLYNFLLIILPHTGTRKGPFSAIQTPKSENKVTIDKFKDKKYENFRSQQVTGEYDGENPANLFADGRWYAGKFWRLRKRDQCFDSVKKRFRCFGTALAITVG